MRCLAWIRRKARRLARAIRRLAGPELTDVGHGPRCDCYSCFQERLDRRSW